MIVDCHAHLVPPELLAAIRKDAAKFPNVRQIEDGGGLALAFAGGKPTRPVSKPLSDVAGRLAWMAKQGIDKQVVGGWVDMFGYELPGAEAEAWARLANECMLAAAKAEPHFVPLATVPLGDGARAASVLKDAVKAGFAGAMIGTLPRGVGSTLDAADLDPFWQAADETGALIHIHPSYDAGDVRVNDFGLANGLGRITDAAVAVARLISAGHVAKYKNAKFFAPMGAAALPFVLGRLKRNACDHAGHRRSGGSARRHLYRHHPARRARVEIRHRDDGHRAADDGLGHAVPDRRHRTAKNRRRGGLAKSAGRFNQWRPGGAAVQDSMTRRRTEGPKLNAYLGGGIK